MAYPTRDFCVANPRARWFGVVSTATSVTADRCVACVLIRMVGLQHRDSPSVHEPPHLRKPGMLYA